MTLMTGLTERLSKEGWVEVPNPRRFVTEISNRPKGCPLCGGTMASCHITSISKDPEGDILATSRACRCGARLVILND
jgi:hypothetical protein